MARKRSLEDENAVSTYNTCMLLIKLEGRFSSTDYVEMHTFIVISL